MEVCRTEVGSAAADIHSDQKLKWCFINDTEQSIVVRGTAKKGFYTPQVYFQKSVVEQWEVTPASQTDKQPLLLCIRTLSHPPQQDDNLFHHTSAPLNPCQRI